MLTVPRQDPDGLPAPAQFHRIIWERSGNPLGNFAPTGWMFCEGQELAISENETLFNLIGGYQPVDSGSVTFRNAVRAEA